ncbi:MAG: UDP-N-acetylmuramate dehydrogenase [Clostridia bacterium]|nr:UDP-N-acetylmuramate dehydrogenase [Clostridia bacterium]
MSLYNDIITICENIGCEYLTDAVLKNYTSFKIGGKADLMVFPDTEKKIISILNVINKLSIPSLIIGKGSNMLISDSGFRGVVINTCRFDKISLIDDETIYCQSGASLSRLCRFALENSLTGLEFAFGIPGTAGGAAYMNAGAYGGEMKDVLVSCEHLSSDGIINRYSGDVLDLSYRHSVYSDSDLFILSLTLKLQKGNFDEIKARMDELMSKRKDKQPLEYPSAGSTFKRPEGYFAAALLDECGLKGYTVGGAQVSEKHAGFVINKGNATAEDVKKLINHCKQTVLNLKGVLLEPEVKIIG